MNSSVLLWLYAKILYCVIIITVREEIKLNSLELLPTEENLILTLKEDILERNEKLVCFYELLLSQENGGAIALDGRWGSGKTFFVKQSMLIINSKNPLSKIEETKKQEILKNIPFHKKDDENYDLAIYYDAWENDNDMDPILSIVYEITKQLGLSYPLKDQGKVFEAAASIMELLSGRNTEGIIRSLKSDNPLSKMEEQKEIQTKLRNFFTDLLPERGNRLVIFIDELDRCKPSYAVKLLEEVKHYLSDERILIVFSVNLRELQHTIKHFYGDSFDACRYLDRFFNLRIPIPPANKNNFYEKIGLTSYDVVKSICKKVIENYNLELREITRYFQQTKTAIYKYLNNEQNFRFVFPDEKGKEWILLFIVPIIIGLKNVDISLYDDFINGKNFQPLIDILATGDLGSYILNSLLNSDETYKEEVEKKLVTKEEKLKKLYDAIFVKQYSGANYKEDIGIYSFDSTSKEFAIKAVSMLSPFADYQS